jgi:hypothetical protein
MMNAACAMVNHPLFRKGLEAGSAELCQVPGFVSALP